MFGIGGWELFILMMAGLFILGPERLPSAAVWAARTIKQVREYATGAREQLTNELGPEFDELRKPLAELQKLRGFNPRTAITKHLLDGDDSFLFGASPTNTNPPTTGISNTTTSNDPPGLKASVGPTKPTPTPTPTSPTLGAGERPPFDADAT